jgi:AI-2 transport protein TqsA
VSIEAEIDREAGVLPRGLAVLLTLAAGIITIAGLKAFSETIGPMFLAVVVVVVLAPLQGMMTRRGAPSWLAATGLLTASFGVIAAILGSVAWAAIELVQLLSGETYERQLSQAQQDLADLANEFGVTGDDLDSVVEGIDLGAVASQLTSALSGVLGLLGTLSLIVLMLLFVVMDSAKFGRSLQAIAAEKPNVVEALRNFSRSTRSCFVVATGFGLIVAVLDVVALVLLGIPLALVWGVLSFITNYIPNVGFVLGLVPPALLGFFEGGWQLSLWVIVIYSVINVVIQSIIQPKFVGDAVGLSATLTFISLMFWAWVIGPLGALLAVPLTLFCKALLVDIDPTTQWAAPLISLDTRSQPTPEAPEPVPETPT